MLGDDYPLLYNNKKEFIEQIEDILDNPNKRKEINRYIGKKITTFKWSERVPLWFNSWKFLDDLDMIGEKSESYKKILQIIKRKKSATKKMITEELNWGVRISFSPYRNKLRSEDDIKLTQTGYQYIGE